MNETERDTVNCVSELQSLGLHTPKLNELNDGYEIGNLIENLKQMYFQEYESTCTLTD